MSRGWLLLLFLLLSASFFAVHILANYFLSSSLLLNEVFKIHFFLFAISIATIYTAFRVKTKLPNYVGFSYLASVLVKMAVSIVFLYPMISSENQHTAKEYILHFFSAFFIYLLSEVIFVSKILKYQ